MRVAGRHHVAILAGVLAAAVLAAACGGGGGGGAKAGPACPTQGIDARISATATTAFSTDKLAVRAGTVVIQLDNQGSTTHTFTIRGVDGVAARVTGSTKQACATYDLQPGSYTFFCSISGHEAAGMKGTITVS